MDIYRDETRANGLEVYRGRSSSAEAPIVGFLGPPEAIRDLLGESIDPLIALEWTIYAPTTTAMRPAEGVPFALCFEITPEDMAGVNPFITWAPIEYDELLEVIGDGRLPLREGP